MESKAAAFSSELNIPTQLELVAKHRALRETSNTILELIQSTLGNTLLAVQQFAYNTLQSIISLLNGIAEWDLFVTLNAVLTLAGINITNIINSAVIIIEFVQVTVDNLLSYFTGSSLV